MLEEYDESIQNYYGLMLVLFLKTIARVLDHLEAWFSSGLCSRRTKAPTPDSSSFKTPTPNPS
jgi:hypothetical protein